MLAEIIRVRSRMMNLRRCSRRTLVLIPFLLTLTGEYLYGTLLEFFKPNPPRQRLGKALPWQEEWNTRPWMYVVKNFISVPVS